MSSGERRADHCRQSALPGIARADFTRLDEHRGKARVDQRARDKAIAAPDVEKRARGRKAAHDRRQAGPAMGEPERVIFELEAVRVTFLRIRNRFALPRIPDAV